MTHPILRHLRSNAVAYLALFVALGGSSYAAITLPRNSVGGRQLRNHSIDPVKLNPTYTGGVVRAWAYVSASGHAYINHGFGRIAARMEPLGSYALDLKLASVRGCEAVASVVFDFHVPGAGQPGYAVTSPPQGPPQQRPAALDVDTFNTTGVQTPLPFVVEMLC